MRGKFIILEGGEGAGKDTQIDLLKKDLGEKDFLFVRDPGGTELGERIRETLLSPGSEKVTRRTELLLYLASRSQLAFEKIIPALQSGKHVISNRFTLSTIAYQIYGRRQQDFSEVVKVMSEFANGEAKPDCYIILDLPPSVGLERVAKQRNYLDRFEKEKVEFHERVREAYKKESLAFPHKIIDASQPIESVCEQVREVIQEIILK